MVSQDGKRHRPLLRSLSCLFRRRPSNSDDQPSSASSEPPPRIPSPAKVERIPPPAFLVRSRPAPPPIPDSPPAQRLTRISTSPSSQQQAAYVCSFKECWSSYCPTHNPQGVQMAAPGAAPQAMRPRTRTVSKIDTIRTPSTATSSESCARTPSLVHSAGSSLSRHSSRRFECYASRCEASNCPEHGRSARNKLPASPRPMSAPPSPTVESPEVVFLPAMWHLPESPDGRERASKLIYLEKPKPLKVVKRTQSSQSLSPRKPKSHARRYTQHPMEDRRRTESLRGDIPQVDDWRAHLDSLPSAAIGIAL